MNRNKDLRQALRPKKGLVLHFTNAGIMENITYEWAHQSIAAITVCNKKGEIIFMNENAKLVFSRYGDDLTGKSLFDCHNEKSAEMIRRLLSDGGSNVYTIEKNGLKKLIHQSAWLDKDGDIGGLTEISMELPDHLPHFIR